MLAPTGMRYGTQVRTESVSAQDEHTLRYNQCECVQPALPISQGPV